jgi:hypothetical protein
MKPYPARLFACWCWLTLLIGSATLHAQDLTLVITTSPEQPESAKVDDILLRPNTEQSLFYFVKNTGAEDRTVTLALRAKDSIADVLRSKPVTVKAGLAEAIVWDIPAPLPTPAVTPGTPTPAVPKPNITELKNPAGEYELILRDEKQKTVGTPRVVKLLRPREYLQRGEVTFNGEAKQLTATLSATNDFKGPEAPVKLILDPARVPGLIDSPEKVGTYQRALTVPGKEVKLIADKLKFGPQPDDHDGLVTIDVDGYERALTYRMTFNQLISNNKGEPITDIPIVRVKAVEFSPARDKLPITLMIDEAPRGVTVEVGLDRNGDGKIDDEDEKRILPGPRQEKLTVRPNSDGSLTFTTEVRDWTLELDVAGLFGKTTLLVQLRKDKKDIVPVLSETEALKKNGETVAVVSQTITFDNSLPKILDFGVFNMKQVKEKDKETKNVLTRGDPVVMFVKAEDDESEIKEVVFFLGKSTEEVPVPPGVDKIPGVLKVEKPDPKDKDESKKKKDVWLAQVPVPTDKGGKVPVSVQVTNKAEVKTFATIVIELQEPAKTDGKDGTGKDGTGKDGAGKGGGAIEGTVTEDGRPQPGVTVVLRDMADKPKDTTKSDAKGRYAFKDVPAGTYTMTAVKTSSNTQATVTVQVIDKQTKEMPIPLQRK